MSMVKVSEKETYELAKEAMESDVTKEMFRAFIKQKKKQLQKLSGKN